MAGEVGISKVRWGALTQCPETMGEVCSRVGRHACRKSRVRSQRTGKVAGWSATRTPNEHAQRLGGCQPAVPRHTCSAKHQHTQTSSLVTAPPTTHQPHKRTGRHPSTHHYCLVRAFRSGACLLNFQEVVLKPGHGHIAVQQQLPERLECGECSLVGADDSTVVGLKGSEEDVLHEQGL